jgi:putative transposase
VVAVANVVAIGVNTAGERRILGTDCGPAEDEAFWTAFLRSLVRRGLKGVQLVISDAHTGLKAAIAKILSGAAWQRCRVHFMRNLLALVPKAAQDAVAALVRTIFYQPDHSSAMAQLGEVAGMLRPRFPHAAELLADAAEDVLAHLHFPKEHRRRLHSTNVVERLHMELKRRTRVVGIFPNRASLRGWWGRCWPSRTTSGTSSTAATSRGSPCSRSGPRSKGVSSPGSWSQRSRERGWRCQSPPTCGT